MINSLWYKNAIFYQVYIRAFADSNSDGHGDLRGLTARLDYFRDLGVDCLWLMPMYPSPLKDDGYDIADYVNIHPDYGTLDDFKTFLVEAHARGLRVITDLVLNHTSDQHPWFQAARADRSSPYRDYYVWSDTDQKYAGVRIVFSDTETSNWAWDAAAGQYYWHRFYSSQPDLNYDNPAVRQAMLDVVKFWLDLGVDGFRADAVPNLFEREGTACENLPETHAYLKEIRRFIDQGYADRILLAEANQWPEDLRAYFGDGDEIHMAFHFPIMPRIYLALGQGNCESLRWILQRTPRIPDNCQWCTFLRNHDELSLEMVSDEEHRWMWQHYAPDPQMRFGAGIRRRLGPLFDRDPRKIELAYSLLFTLPGSPIIYYGDEIGLGDNVALPDRNGVRTPMQWTAEANAGFSTAPADRLYAQPIDDYGIVNVAAQRADPNSLWHHLRRMMAARKAHPVLGQGECECLSSGNRAVFVAVRSDRSETIVAAHNLSDAAQSIAIDLRRWPGAHVHDLLSDVALRDVSDQPYALTLRSYQSYWLALRSL
jgi:maltose alpha-D-glucosyltransferase/alpha-amylase